MDKYVIRLTDQVDLPSQHQLLLSGGPKLFTADLSNKRSLLAGYEIHGRALPAFKRLLLQLMLRSYSEIGSFLQSFPISELSRHLSDTPGWGSGSFNTLPRYDPPARGSRFTNYTKRPYVSCIDFDSKGIYLASVSSTGCLSIHEFETLYCSAAKRSNEDGASFIRYISTDRALEAVRWNPANQDEVACVAAGSNKVYFYDIACDSFLPSEVLRVKSNVGIVGLHDLMICKYGVSRILACGKDGNVHIWDRRASKLSYAALPVPNISGALNSLQLSNDEQVVYAGSEGGLIHAWDLREENALPHLLRVERSSLSSRPVLLFAASHVNHVLKVIDVYHQPFGAVKVATALSSISSLRAQTEIGASAVHAISLDSSCGHRLAFHLNNGWSGVLDMTTLEVTHLHCPPPPWLEELDSYGNLNRNIFARLASPGPVIRRRRPVWVPSYSVYAVASALEPHIHLLDFSHGPQSRYSIQHNHSDSSDHSEDQWQVELTTSEAVVAVAAHPLNDQLVAGTQGGKLLLLGQKKISFGKEDMRSLTQ